MEVKEHQTSTNPSNKQTHPMIDDTCLAAPPYIFVRGPPSFLSPGLTFLKHNTR